jgi:hypothetical protein
MVWIILAILGTVVTAGAIFIDEPSEVKRRGD